MPKNPYLDVVTGSVPVPSKNQKLKQQQESAKTNPYMEAALGYNSGLEEARGIKREDEFKKMQDETLHPGLVKGAGQFVSELPNAFATLGKEVATHPLRSAQSLLLGLMDVGPAAVNFGNAIIGKIFPGYTDANTGGFLGLGYEKLPSLSKAFSDYNDKNPNDAQAAISEGSKMFGAYEIGGGVTGGARSLSGQALGNILGGQIVVEPETSAKDRAKQAVFDGLFGVATHYTPKAITGATNKITGTKPATPEMVQSVLSSIDDHAKSSNMVLSELPKGEIDNLGGMSALLERTKTNIVEGLKAQGHSGAATAVEKLNTAKFSTIDDLAAAARKSVQKGFRTSAAPSKTLSAVEGDIAETPGELGSALRDAPPQAGSNPVEVPATNPFMPDNAAVATPEIKYIAKKSLGNDESGARRLATTEVDSKTGNAVVYYAKDLDKPENALLKQQVLDHEMGHIFDKRVNEFAGNISAELPNYAGNAANLDNVLGNFARSMGESVESVVGKLQSDIATLSDGVGRNPGEAFAEAFSKFRAAPDEARKAAPTFSALMEYKPVPERFSTHHFTEADAGASLKASKAVNEKAAKAKKDVAPETKVTTDFEDVADHLPDGQREDFLTHIKPKLDQLRKPKADEQVIFRTGGGKWTDTEVFHAVERGVTDKTEVRIVKKSALKSTGDAAKDAEGIRLLEEGKQTKPTKTKKPKDSVEGDEKPPKRASKTASGKFASTNLDTGKRVEGKSSFNPDQINAPQDVEVFFNKMDASKKNFSEQRISKSNEDIKDLARLVGLKEDDLINLKPGSIANSETLLASRQLILDKVHEMVNTLKGIDPANMTDAQAKDIRDQFVRLIAIQKSVAGLRTEASNALRSFGVELRPGENFAIQDLATKLKEFGLGEEAADLARFSKKVAEDFELTPAQRLGGGFLQTWYSAILSGPKTQVRNFESTMGNIITDTMAKAFDPKLIKEIPTSVAAGIRGFAEAAPKLKQEAIDAILLRGNEATDVSKFTDFGTLRQKAPIFTGKWSTFGKITEIPGRLLAASDTFMRAGPAEAQKAALKVYSPEMSEAVQKAVTQFYAEQSVFHGVPKGRISRGMVRGLEALRYEAPVLKLIFPFVKTIANVIDRQFDYMPIFAQFRLMPKFVERQIDDLVRETKVNLTDAERDMLKDRLFHHQLGRANMGLALTAGAVPLAMKGLISGSGPTNYNERLQLERTGWRKNSIKIGDTWVPYTYMGPLAGILALAGNIHDSVVYDKTDAKSVPDLVAAGLFGWMQTQLDQSYLTGASDLLDVVNGTKDYKKWLSNTGSSLIPIPAAYSQTKDMIFRQQYETNGIVDNIRKKLGLTGGVFGMDPLHPRLDAMGEPMRSDLIYGITPSKEVDERVTSFLVANDIIVNIPLKNQEYSIPGKGKVRMTPDQYEEYVRGSGNEIYKQLDALIPRMSRLTDDQKADMVKTTVDSIREDWRYKVLLKDGK